MNALIKEFFDTQTNTISYVVYDKENGHGAIIDPVLDYNPKSGEISTHNADKILSFVDEKNLTIEWILETHVHADHLTSAQYLKSKLNTNTKIGINKNIVKVQEIFKQVFNMNFVPNGADFDYLFKDNECFNIGSLTACVMFLQGHTPADTAYKIENVLFVGDSIFMPDVGTARCDFPQGDADKLYTSIQKILSLDDNVKLYMCHDYPQNREVQYQSTIGQQKACNIHIKDEISQQEFINLRNARDKALELPALIYPAIQVNIRAGKLPSPESNNIAYLKMPLKL